MAAWRAPVRRVSAEVMEHDPGAAWLAEDDGARDVLACPCCGRLIGVRGMKGWLLRRLRQHFAKCRPKFRIYRRRDAERLEARSRR